MLYTKDSIISDLQRFHQKYNKIPAMNDFNPKKEGFPGIKTIMRVFGDWNGALKEAGFDTYKEQCIKTHKINNCKCCGETIHTKLFDNKRFCNRSCAATYTNTKRGPLNDATKRKISESMNAFYYETGVKDYPYSNVYFVTCGCCEKIFFTKSHNRRYCSDCIFTRRKRYKLVCKFSISHKDYPELFNGHLIKKYGWYQPASTNKSNPDGVTWDHLYPLHLGFKNKVPVEVMKHPANAEMVPYQENIRRYKDHRLMITLDELYRRIELWDNGRRDLPYFYKE
jgi:hypothetical protein